MENHELTPLYARLLLRFTRPFPNWDLFFIKALRRAAVASLHLSPGDRVLDAGCGSGGTFPYLVDAVGANGEVVGLEISPETAINAHRRIAANRWPNVHVLVGDARTVDLPGFFDGLVMFAAPDVYASPAAVTNLLPHLKDGARIAVFGAKLSARPAGKIFNLFFRALMKLSFRSTPSLTHDPLSALGSRLADIQMQEYLCGCMFLASASVVSATSLAPNRLSRV